MIIDTIRSYFEGACDLFKDILVGMLLSCGFSGLFHTMTGGIYSSTAWYDNAALIGIGIGGAYWLYTMAKKESK